MNIESEKDGRKLVVVRRRQSIKSIRHFKAGKNCVLHKEITEMERKIFLKN